MFGYKLTGWWLQAGQIDSPPANVGGDHATLLEEIQDQRRLFPEWRPALCDD